MDGATQLQGFCPSLRHYPLSKVGARGECNLTTLLHKLVQSNSLHPTLPWQVVSGCVLGAKPPPKVHTCPAGYILKTGAYSTKYCSPCPPGTTSSGSNSRSCTYCPAGTYSPMYGGRQCKKCTRNRDYGDAGDYQQRVTYYSPSYVVAADQCMSCNRAAENKWSDATSCKACPAGSSWSRSVPNQCVKCSAGKKCCTVNWTGKSGSCPKCPAAGTPGSPPAPMPSPHAL
jgi:hypothetical protein